MSQKTVAALGRAIGMEYDMGFVITRGNVSQVAGILLWLIQASSRVKNIAAVPAGTSYSRCNKGPGNCQHEATFAL